MLSRQLLGRQRWRRRRRVLKLQPLALLSGGDAAVMCGDRACGNHGVVYDGVADVDDGDVDTDATW